MCSSQHRRIVSRYKGIQRQYPLLRLTNDENYDRKTGGFRQCGRLFVFTAVDAEYVERKNTEWKMRHKITGMEKFTKEN